MVLAKEIAKQLYISEGTVKNTISIILDKLELRDRTQLAIYLLANESRCLNRHCYYTALGLNPTKLSFRKSIEGVNNFVF